MVEELYERYFNLLRNFAFSLCHNMDEAEDLVQETFMKALSYGALLETLPEYKRRAWLFTVLKNRFIDLWRKKKFETHLEKQVKVSQNVKMSQLAISSLLSSLPELFRDIIYKHYYLGMTSREISEELSIPASTVRYYLRKARKLIKKKI